MPYRDVAEAATRWVLAQVRYDDLGPWIPVSLPHTEPAWDRDGMHSGIGGVGLLLAEIAGVREWTVDEAALAAAIGERLRACLLYTSPSPRDRQKSRMPSSA